MQKVLLSVRLAPTTLVNIQNHAEAMGMKYTHVIQEALDKMFSPDAMSQTKTKAKDEKSEK